jgi:hypothetical protein
MDVCVLERFHPPSFVNHGSKDKIKDGKINLSL